MCVGIKTEFPECGHFKIEYTTSCEAGFNEPENRCNQDYFFMARQRVSTSPTLCVYCYRRKVDDIIFCYKQKLQEIDWELAELKIEARACMVAHQREEMKRQKMALEGGGENVLTRGLRSLKSFGSSRGFGAMGESGRGIIRLGLGIPR